MDRATIYNIKIKIGSRVHSGKNLKENPKSSPNTKMLGDSIQKLIIRPLTPETFSQPKTLKFWAFSSPFQLELIDFLMPILSSLPPSTSIPLAQEGCPDNCKFHYCEGVWSLYKKGLWTCLGSRHKIRVEI